MVFCSRVEVRLGFGRSLLKWDLYFMTMEPHQGRLLLGGSGPCWSYCLIWSSLICTQQPCTVYIYIYRKFQGEHKNSLQLQVWLGIVKQFHYANANECPKQRPWNWCLKPNKTALFLLVPGPKITEVVFFYFDILWVNLCPRKKSPSTVQIICIGVSKHIGAVHNTDRLSLSFEGGGRVSQLLQDGPFESILIKWSDMGPRKKSP